MTTLSKHHRELKNNKGKCSVPMWSGGCPAGFCDKDAFGERPKAKGFNNPHTGEFTRFDGKYSGYVPGLACPGHGGPECPGIELGDGNYSGCSGTGGDCPTCGK